MFVVLFEKTEPLGPVFIECFVITIFYKIVFLCFELFS